MLRILELNDDASVRFVPPFASCADEATIVVLTARNHLDEQIFGTFSRCWDLPRQPRVRAADRAGLREKLKVASGGVVFTAIQKFFPEERGDWHLVLS